MRDGWTEAREGLDRTRTALRGWLLPVFAWPLLWDVMVEILRGNPQGLVAALLGLGLPVVAVRVLRRGRRGDTHRAAMIMAVATGLVSLLGGGQSVPMALLVGAGAWLGTRLLYDGAVQEAEPPRPPAEAPPPGLLEAARERLARIRAQASGLPEPRIEGVARAMSGVLDDLATRPARLPEARRFLTVHLDGLERITERLAAGAAPPPGLPSLLDDLTSAAEDLRNRLRAHETEALEIQVKVLADRLRQEGYA